MRSGLCVGKFLPPHAGHALLIDTARALCDRLSVVVCDHPADPIPAALRAGWLRAQHPDVAVLVVRHLAPDADSAAWAAYARLHLGSAPDVVFSSEDYGERFAAELGCEHVVVDRERVRIPISATAIRARPLEHLDDVAPDVRAYLVRRVCVVGPESTGKTTLCEQLARRFGAPFVREYGRDYTIAKARGPEPDRWHPDEFVHIAREQQRREDEAARTAPGLVLCDTDAFATEIWLERYLGRGHELRGWPVRARPIDRYLLSDPDVPFVPDSIRDGEHLRAWMYGRFREELDARAFPYDVLSGSYEFRYTDSVRAIERVIAEAKVA